YISKLEKANDFFTHYWSLCVELQFYLIAPLILHFFKPIEAASSFTFIILHAVASFAYSLLRNSEDAFDSTLARLWQFLFGALAFQIDLVRTFSCHLHQPLDVFLQ
ncbi:hypothetical protein PMAYCL1PPCAC_08616, partial [Pristionchus mayeri]